VRTVHLHGPFSPREKDKMRAGFTAVFPHPGPLPEGEGEKQYALFDGRISKTVADWSYSSFHRFVSRGVYPAHWAGKAASERGGDYGEPV